MTALRAEREAAAAEAARHLVIVDAGPDLDDCDFIANYASADGGAAYAKESDQKRTCIFTSKFIFTKLEDLSKTTLM